MDASQDSLKATIAKAGVIADCLWVLACPLLWLVRGGAKFVGSTMFIDNFVYLGYANNFQELTRRYGSAYYPTRVTAIAPAAYLQDVFGVDAGYLVWKYLLFVIAFGSIFSLAQKIGGRTIAVLTTGLMLVIPWLPGSLVSDYVDGVAVAFMLLAIALLLVPSRFQMVASSLAGVAACTALIAQFAVVPFLLIVLVMAFFGSDAGSLRRKLATIILTLTSGTLWYLLINRLYLTTTGFSPAQSILRTNWAYSRRLDAGESRKWFGAFWPSVRANNYFALFVAVGIASPISVFVCRRRLRESKQLRMTACYASASSLTVLLALAMHFRGYGLLSKFYALSLLIPGVILGLSALLAVTVTNFAPRRFTLYAISLATLFSLRFAINPLMRLPQQLLVVALASIALVLPVSLVTYSPKSRRAIALAFAAIALVVSISCFSHQHYLLAVGTAGPDEFPVRSLAVHFQNGVSDEIDPDHRVLFWYDDAIWYLNAAQSTYLWGYSRLTFTPWPHLNDEDRVQLAEDIDLVLIGQTRSSVRQMLKIICPGKVRAHARFTRLQSRTYILNYIVLRSVSNLRC